MTGDLGNYRAADTHAWTAWMCAEQAGHDGARAWIRTTQAKLAYWDGRCAESAQLAEDGLGYESPDSARVFLALFRARALARIGQSDQARQALTQADAERDRVTSPDLLGGVWELTPGRYHGLTASTSLLLDRPGAAVAQASEAIRLSEQAPPDERHLYAELMVRLPPASPLSSLRQDAERCSWLTSAQRSWVLRRATELEGQYADATWTLGRGMIHGDACAENLIHTCDRVVLADRDSVSVGPREQDIVPASIRYRFGRPRAEWEQFCAAYGVDPDDLPGLAVLRQMRELRTLVPYLRSTGRPRAQAEVSRRIADLMSGTQREPWEALNLAL